ncbi:hypothetical protein BBK82_15770 [Lentzea guizhouensis]|uniref:DUF3558 domain-containing protein n=1 Tax=Lentzea guizhouensis TaxID=1586287 RepID=A0A1B2HHW1_9PSEU|nr:DUF3558 domain-containing protein [Lentzea guizhouensis]ANZ37300.1 hypothetical protein BBK82_15770 [Lentzea guizhouensis]
MTKYTGKIFVLAAFAAATVSACTGGGEQGKATTPSAPPPSSSDSSQELPSRPQELKVDGVDPCKLLTADQMKQIKVASTKSVQPNIVDKKPSPACFYQNSLDYTYTVGVVTHNGVPYWLRSGGTVESKLVDVSGYGAAEIKFVGTNDVDCAIAVDVADGQQLFVSYKPLNTESQEEMCGKAKTAAGLALVTLKTLK